jgi:hypothetical protein
VGFVSGYGWIVLFLKQPEKVGNLHDSRRSVLSQPKQIPILGDNKLGSYTYNNVSDSTWIGPESIRACGCIAV